MQVSVSSLTALYGTTLNMFFSVGCGVTFFYFDSFYVADKPYEEMRFPSSSFEYCSSPHLIFLCSVTCEIPNSFQNTVTPAQ